MPVDLSLASRIAANPAPAARGWAPWCGALLLGVMLLLLVLVASWVLRACAPVDALTSYSTIETPAPSRASAPPADDPAPALRVSLDRVRSAGQGLRVELAALTGDLQKKVEQCAPAGVDFPAERWIKGDLSVLKGCWQLGRDTSMSHRFADGRTEKVVTKAGRLCFDDNGTGLHERITIGPGERWDCKAPITAKFWNNGTFVANQPDVMCEGSPPVQWAAMRLACRRVSDTMAICHTTDHSGHTEVEFRRAP